MRRIVAKTIPKTDDGCISTSCVEVCACCRQLKYCKMYVLQNGTTAWICKKCREGNK